MATAADASHTYKVTFSGNTEEDVQADYYEDHESWIDFIATGPGKSGLEAVKVLRVRSDQVRRIAQTS